MCSHQESNLDRRYRKPIFYPLNYESNTKNISQQYFLKRKNRLSDFFDDTR